MDIRIMYEHGEWKAYFCGSSIYAFHGKTLEAMCRTIERFWPMERYRKAKEK